MSDARWLEVDRDVASAVQHFSNAARLFADPELRADSFEGHTGDST